MSFARFMWSGIPGSHKRENFPENTVKAIKTSYDYSGKITEQSYIPYAVTSAQIPSNQYRVYMIDDAVQVKLAVPEHQKLVKEDLDRHATNAGITAFAGGAGLAYSLYKMATCDYTYAIGVIASIGVTASAIGRSEEASRESFKWNDPTQAVCNARKNAAKDFNVLRNDDLRGSHFTTDETKDIFFTTVSKLRAEHNKNMATGSSEIVEQSVRKFVKDNPLNDDSVEYAFPKDAEIFNPRKPGHGHWKREDLVHITSKSRQLKTDFTLFQADTERQIREIENNVKLVNAAVSSTNLLAQNVIAGGVSNELHDNLSEHQAELDKLARLREKGQISHEEYTRKLNEIVSTHSRAANNTLHQGTQTSFYTSTAALFAGGVTSLYKVGKMDALLNERRSKLIEKFPQQIDDVLQDYSSKRFGMSSSETE